jgi:hypothetical protein
MSLKSILEEAPDPLLDFLEVMPIFEPHMTLKEAMHYWRDQALLRKEMKHEAQRLRKAGF